ncbi:unnamed protein product [Brassica oleracea]|uniref:(rape) hypothetical protein n=1 Tax=Brassica napus TaxID=3708 RepID=A0A816JWS9_BRANA|nr:unnamed protein product [Brassica napus]
MRICTSNCPERQSCVLRVVSLGVADTCRLVSKSFCLLAFSSRWRFWSQLLTVSNRRLLSLAVAVISSPSRSFTVTKPLRLALPSSLGSRSGEEKASILSNGGVLRSCKTEQPEFEDGFNENAEDLAPTMLELWNLMDTPIEEQQEYQQITCNIAASEHEITQANSLSEDFIQYCNGRVGENLKDELENVSVQLGELRRNKAENESV